MSEIDIERKESGGIPWWLWLLGALILAAIIWYATSSMSAKPGVAVATADNGALVDNSTVVDNGTLSDNGVGLTDNTTVTDANAATSMMDANAATSNEAMGQSMSANTQGNSAAAVASSEAITDILSVVDAKSPSDLYGKDVKLLGAPVQAAGTKVFWIGPSFEQKMLVVTDSSTNMNGINTEVSQRDRVNIEGTIQEITDFTDAKEKYNLDDNAITFLTNKKILLVATSVSKDKK